MSEDKRSEQSQSPMSHKTYSKEDNKAGMSIETYDQPDLSANEDESSEQVPAMTMD